MGRVVYFLSLVEATHSKSSSRSSIQTAISHVSATAVCGCLHEEKERTRGATLGYGFTSCQSLNDDTVIKPTHTTKLSNV